MKYHKIIILYLILNTLYFILPTHIHADYVLPYPSYMPGNKLYRVSRIVDRLKQYWYFGSIASFRYHLELSDKYLVEAKTLFEYKQYSLAVDALQRSDMNFSRLPDYYKRAGGEGKDVTLLTAKLTDASLKHREILSRLAAELPNEFNWEPEKKQATLLPLKKLLTESLAIRQAVGDQINR